MEICYICHLVILARRIVNTLIVNTIRSYLSKSPTTICNWPKKFKIETHLKFLFEDCWKEFLAFSPNKLILNGRLYASISPIFKALHNVIKIFLILNIYRFRENRGRSGLPRQSGLPHPILLFISWTVQLQALKINTVLFLFITEDSNRTYKRIFSDQFDLEFYQSFCASSSTLWAFFVCQWHFHGM